MPQLIVSIEDDFPQVVEVNGPKFTIGRHSGNHLQLPFSFISSFHAEMVQDASGNYRLSDLDSHNGTFIDGNPVNDTTVKDGDQVAIGPIKARFIVTVSKPSAAGAIPEARPAYIADSPETSAALSAAPMAISQAHIEATLREKITSELERESVATTEALRSVTADYERIVKESEIQKSDMAMREHIVRDLEKSRIREAEQLESVRAEMEEFETARRDLADIQAKIAESRDAGEQAEVALKNLLDYESRTVQLEAEVTAKQNEADELELAATTRRRELAASAEELEVLRHEVDEVGGSTLLDLQAEVERLRQQSTELDKGITLRTERAEKLDADRKATEKRCSDFTSRANELSTEVAEGEKKLTELTASVTEKEKVVAAATERLDASFAAKEKELASSFTDKEKETAAAIEKVNTTLAEKEKKSSSAQEKLDGLRAESERLEKIRVPELKKQVEHLDGESKKKQEELEDRLKQSQEADARREEAENKTTETKAQLAEANKELEQDRRDREKLLKELQEARASVDVLKKEIEKHGAENKDLLEKRRLVEEEVMNSSQLRDELQAKIKESRMAASQCEAEVKKLEEVQARQKEIDTEFRGRQGELTTVNKDLETKTGRLAEVEKSLAENREKVEEITTVRLVKLRAESDELEKGKAEKRKEIDSFVAQSEKDKADRSKVIEGLVAEIEKLTQKGEDQKNYLAEKTAERKHLDSECSDRTSEIKKLSSENDSLQKERTTIKGDLETARSQLAEARKQADDFRKVGKKVAAELRSLEGYQAANARAKTDLAEQESELKDLDKGIAERRKALRQVEKTLGSIQRKGRKEKRRILIPLTAKTVDEAESDKEPELDKDSNDRIDEEAARKAEELERKNEELATRLAEKESALATLEAELNDIVSSASVAPAAKDENAAAAPIAKIENLDTRDAPDGIELLNTGDDDDLPEPESKATPKTGPKPDAKPEAKPEAKGRDKDKEDAKPEARDEDKAKAEPDTKAKSDSKAKADAKFDSKAKADAKFDSKAKADANATAKTEVNVETKTEVNVATMPEAKSKEAAKSDSKIKSIPLSTPESRGGSRASLASKFLRDDVPAVAAAVIAGGRRRLGAVAGGRKRSTDPGEGIPLRIVHPRSREMTRFFTDGPGMLESERQPPIGLFALAACTRGSIHRSAESLPDDNDPVLLLLGGSLEKDGELIRSIASEHPDRPLLVCWREGRFDKLAVGLERKSAFQQFADMLGDVDGIVSTDDRTTALLKELQVATPTLEIPLPYPIDFPKWDYSIPVSKRKDAVFVSADGYDPEIEDHRTRLELVNLIAAKHRLRVTVYHHLPDLLTNLNVPEDLLDEPNKTLSYGSYLASMAKHRFSVGFGKNLVGGEVMGDALLTGTAYMGGREGIEPILFTGSSLVDGDLEDLQEKMSILITDPDAYAKSLEASKKRALTRISFAAIRQSLDEFITPLVKDESAVTVS